MKHSDFSVAIVGGGFSGVMTALHLLNQGADRVVLFEAQERRLAGGYAYTPASQHHLLNVANEMMGALPDSVDGFHQWLRNRGRTVAGSDFVPREWYGEYLREIFADLKRRFADRLTVICDEVSAVLPVGERFAVRFGAGEVAAQSVVLALGTMPRRVDVLGGATKTGAGNVDRLVQDPWSVSLHDRAGRGDHIALIGSGLSAVDVIVEGVVRGFNGRYTVVSTSGMFPQPHTLKKNPAPVISGRLEWRSTREAFRALRDAAEKAPVWQGVIDEVRPHTNRWWRELPREERNRFQRHLGTLWDRHRHRMPEAASEAIRDLQARGKLVVVSAAVERVICDGNQVETTARNIGEGKQERVVADWAVNCTGFEIRADRVQSRLVRELLASGLMRTDEHGAVQSDGAGQIAPGIWIVGAMRKGELFETTAVRELRVQAKEVAGGVLEQLARSQSTTAGMVVGMN